VGAAFSSGLGIPRPYLRNQRQAGRPNIPPGAHGTTARHVFRCTFQSFVQETMPNLCAPILLPGSMEALGDIVQAARLRGSYMFWCCCYIFSFMLDSYQAVLVIDRIISFMLATISPGFLRAGRRSGKLC
jgi:hypothetical protein